MSRERIGKYRLLAHVGAGGMGNVYKARDEFLGRIVALKVLPPDLAENPTLLERFQREARHAARLQHKNIVTLFEYGEADGLYYLAMEFIDGMDLSEYIRRRGTVDPEEARRIIMQACKALDHAYTQGITHRDIKPSNFLLATEEGRCRIKLTDFGLARMEKEEDFRVTRAGTTVGTVDYLSPEQARDSSKADIRSDIYSLGCTLYHMLAGQPPFAEGGIGERIYKHLAVAPADVRQVNPQVSAGLWAVLRRMLAKNPDDRYQTPAELLEALRTLSGGRVPAEGEDQAVEAPPVTRLTPAQGLEIPPAGAQGRQPPRPLEEPDSARPRKRRKSRSSDAERETVADVPEDSLPLSPEQRQAAAGQFERAQEVAGSGNSDYALQLLLSCCKLDPVNVGYRKALREVGRASAEQKKSRWLGSLATLTLRGKFKAARHAGDHRKVLEQGEELLTRVPDDIGVQLDMAESASALGLNGLAVWLLEQARKQEPENTTVLRALAALYERQRNFARAVSMWERVRKADPADLEAAGKITALAASETIARGNYKRS